MDEIDVPTWLTTTEITAPVRHHLDNENAAITDWTCQRLAGGPVIASRCGACQAARSQTMCSSLGRSS